MLDANTLCGVLNDAALLRKNALVVSATTHDRALSNSENSLQSSTSQALVVFSMSAEASWSLPAIRNAARAHCS